MNETKRHPSADEIAAADVAREAFGAFLLGREELGEAGVLLPTDYFRAGYVAASSTAAERARVEEREACARLAETQYRRDSDGDYYDLDSEGVRSLVQRRIAKAIRTRSIAAAVGGEERNDA